MNIWFRDDKRRQEPDEIIAYLNRKKRLFLQCLEKLPKDVIDKAHEVLVRLLTWERLLICKN
jgi:hypothetical protein